MLHNLIYCCLYTLPKILASVDQSFFSIFFRNINYRYKRTIFGTVNYSMFLQFCVCFPINLSNIQFNSEILRSVLYTSIYSFGIDKNIIFESQRTGSIFMYGIFFPYNKQSRMLELNKIPLTPMYKMNRKTSTCTKAPTFIDLATTFFSLMKVCSFHFFGNIQRQYKFLYRIFFLYIFFI